MIHRCRDIHQWATDTLNLLADDDVKAADVAALKKAIDTFEASQAKPRKTKATGRAAGKQLDALFGQLTKLFNRRLDKLAAKFKQSEPEFSGGLPRVARDRRSVRRSGAEEEVEGRACAQHGAGHEGGVGSAKKWHEARGWKRPRAQAAAVKSVSPAAASKLGKGSAGFSPLHAANTWKVEAA